MESSDALFEPIDCELIIGIVGAVGTHFSDVIDRLKSQLQFAGYTVDTIKVSQDVISQVTDVPQHRKDDDFERYSAFMKAGNQVRRDSKRWSPNGPVSGNNAILALGVAARIFQRSLDNGTSPQPRFKKAYIVDSLKRKEEVEALRSIYGDGFVLVGIHETEEQRIHNLSKQGRMSKDDALELIARDHAETTDPFGQRVNDTFHLADFFVEIRNERSDLECSIRRLVEIWFGHPYRTPTFEEYAMYMAHSAALRSADLSRQVGAVLTRGEHILSTGANECPRPMGGLYWADRNFDIDCGNDVEMGRDYRRGVDSNRKAQLEMIDAIVEKLAKNLSSEETQSLKDALNSSPIADITEYGRVVHAEMEALLACARLGISTQGTTLFCTTFPCHNCAKHIIAAGVTRVVFIEPYPKSRALEHHDDAISETAREGRVQFVPFTGVGPRRFYDLFSIDGSASYRIKRKDRESGKILPWKLQSSRLRIQMRAFTYLEAEAQAARLFVQWNPKGEATIDD